MKKILKWPIAGMVVTAALFGGTEARATLPGESGPGGAGRLVILHSNDTHSQIDPNDKGLGGVLRRKVLIDSVRGAEPNVMVIDAGDAVQGTLFFSLFKGEVEQKMMNALGYDIQILGNHEFDNGIGPLAEQWKKASATLLCTNYDLGDTSLGELTKPYLIRDFGGKKIAFIAINLDPDGMIADKNSAGVRYLDGVKAANSTAWHLKHNEGVDMVIAVTHIGYKGIHGYSDVDLVNRSEDIDVVIGGHSHTKIDPADPDGPAWLIPNALGDSVLVAQTPKGGVYLGEIDIDLETMRPTSKLISVNSRLDDRIDPRAEAILSPYRHSIDSIQAIRVGTARRDFSTGEEGLVNLLADFVAKEGESLTGRKVDLALMNRGGIRCGINKGPITKGRIMMMLPFDNRIVVLRLKGSDLLEAFDVMASRGGDGISGSGRAVIDPQTAKCVSVTIDGAPVDPERVYTVATIDYLANGGDYMTPLKRGEWIAVSDYTLSDDLVDQFQHGWLKGRKLTPDNSDRWTRLTQTAP